MKFAGKDCFASIVLALAAWAAPGLRADVTIRYQTELKPSPALQAMLGKQMASLAGSATVVRMKGNKGYTTKGDWNEIFDFVKGDVTLVDPAHKTFATLPQSQLADQVAEAIPQATGEQMKAAQEALAAIKSSVVSKVTGKTAEIQGVRAEEREVTLTMDMPMPGVDQPGPFMKMVMHIWTAQREEALRVPAIRELTGYQAWQKYMLNPAGMLEKVAGKVPGLSATLGPLLEEIFKSQAVVLRIHSEMYMPFMAMVAKEMDPDAPVMEMSQEAAELSGALVDPALFEIPKDYAAVPAGDMIRAMVMAQIPAKK